MKKSIKSIRGNVSEKLWEITKDFDVLIRENWTLKAMSELEVCFVFFSIVLLKINFSFIKQKPNSQATSSMTREAIRKITRKCKMLLFLC